MKKSFYIQNDLQETYDNLLDTIPEPLRDDIQTQRTILVYLKLGGERLAQHGIEIIRKRFQREQIEINGESQATEAYFSEEDDMTEPHPHELGGFEFPTE